MYVCDENQCFLRPYQFRWQRLHRNALTIKWNTVACTALFWKWLPWNQTRGYFPFFMFCRQNWQRSVSLAALSISARPLADKNLQQFHINTEMFNQLQPLNGNGTVCNGYPLQISLILIWEPLFFAFRDRCWPIAVMQWVQLVGFIWLRSCGGYVNKRFYGRTKDGSENLNESHLLDVSK